MKYVWLKIVVDHNQNPAPTWDGWKIFQYQHTEYVRVFTQLNHICTISLGTYSTRSMSTNRKGYGDLQILNQLESVRTQHLVSSENSDTTHWLRCVDAYCGNIVAGLVFLYKFIWSTDDSSWVVACCCCHVFSIKCGFDIIIYIYTYV